MPMERRLGRDFAPRKLPACAPRARAQMHWDGTAWHFAMVEERGGKERREREKKEGE